MQANKLIKMLSETSPRGGYSGNHKKVGFIKKQLKIGLISLNGEACYRNDR